MGFPTEQLVKWIQNRLVTIDTDDDGSIANIIRFELFHAIDGEGASRLETVRVEPGFNARDAAVQVWAAAENDAETRTSGVQQRYTLGAFTEDEREPVSVHTFIIKPNPLSSSKLLGLDTEQPNEKGIVAHTLRHNESMHRMLIAMSNATAGNLAERCERQDQQIARLQADRDEFFELTQKMLDRRQERELDNALAVQRSKRMDELIGMGMSMIPLLAGAVLGKKVPAVKSTGRDQAIGQFLKSLSEEEALAVFGALKPENQMTLAQLYESYKKDSQTEQASKPAVLRDEDPDAKPAEIES